MRGAIKYFPRALASVAWLSMHGADKYSWAGWAEVEDGIQRYDDAVGRHLIGEAIEGEFDQAWLQQNKRVRHAQAVAWNALARLELILRAEENEQRSGNKTDTGSTQTTESSSTSGENVQPVQRGDGRRLVFGDDQGSLAGVEVVVFDTFVDNSTKEGFRFEKIEVDGQFFCYVCNEENCSNPICTANRVAQGKV